MTIVTESQPVAKPTYIHLAYLSSGGGPSEGGALGIGILLGLILLAYAVLSAWHNGKAKQDQPNPPAPAQPDPSEKPESSPAKAPHEDVR
jgi:uncharacterized membrane protein YebE (DUF533 family)